MILRFSFNSKSNALSVSNWSIHSVEYLSLNPFGWVLWMCLFCFNHSRCLSLHTIQRLGPSCKDETRTYRECILDNNVWSSRINRIIRHLERQTSAKFTHVGVVWFFCCLCNRANTIKWQPDTCTVRNSQPYQSYVLIIIPSEFVPAQNYDVLFVSILLHTKTEMTDRSKREKWRQWHKRSKMYDLKIPLSRLQTLNWEWHFRRELACHTTSTHTRSLPQHRCASCIYFHQFGSFVFAFRM